MVKYCYIKFKKLDNNAIIPQYAHDGDAGFDICINEDIEVPPHTTVLAHTGLACEVPYGFELQVRARSGLSLKTPLIIKNGVGTIDSNYRGEIGIICHNLGDVPLKFNKHDRIAQGVLSEVCIGRIFEVDELSDTNRGNNGFGSSGVNTK